MANGTSQNGQQQAAPQWNRLYFDEWVAREGLDLIRGYKDAGGVVQRVATASGAVVIDELQSGITGVVVDSAGLVLQGTRVWVQGTQAEDTTDTQGTFSLPALGAVAGGARGRTPARRPAR